MKDEKSVKRRALFYVEHVISLRRDMDRLIGVFAVLVSAFMFAGQAVAQNVQEQPKKINERPVVASATPAPEPFDGATVEPNSGTTHFFILLNEATQLDGKFSAFGRVTRGMEVVDAINKAPAEGEKPAKPIIIKRAIVETCEKKPQ